MLRGLALWTQDDLSKPWQVSVEKIHKGALGENMDWVSSPFGPNCYFLALKTTPTKLKDLCWERRSSLRRYLNRHWRYFHTVSSFWSIATTLEVPVSEWFPLQISRLDRKRIFSLNTQPIRFPRYHSNYKTQLSRQAGKTSWWMPNRMSVFSLSFEEEHIATIQGMAFVFAVVMFCAKKMQFLPQKIFCSQKEQSDLQSVLFLKWDCPVNRQDSFRQWRWVNICRFVDLAINEVFWSLHCSVLVGSFFDMAWWHMNIKKRPAGVTFL